METVRVELGPQSYEIQIGAGNLASVGPAVARLGRVSHVVVLTDKNVERPHAVRVVASLAGEGLPASLVVVEPGERSKSLETAAVLWSGLLQIGADRGSLLLACGGGVVGDLAGFVAATFARGIRFFQVPTSLLAQVDSSVGGKVGINLPEAKNIVGAFWQPQGVLIDTQTLETLAEREYRSGLGEVVKYGVILDATLFEFLERHAEALCRRDPGVLVEVIARCCRLKARVVEQDEREQSGLRAVLNYGHTFAHAFETLTGYGELLHGEAVAMGMICAARLAERLGRIGRELTQRQEELLRALGLPLKAPKLNVSQVLKTMQHDKKAQHGRLRFVLPVCLGKVELVDQVDPCHVRAVLEAGS